MLNNLNNDTKSLIISLCESETNKSNNIINRNQIKKSIKKNS